MTMNEKVDSIKQGSEVDDFFGYVYFLLNSDDGDIYVLSLVSDENGTRSLQFLPKEKTIDPETTVIGWSEDLTFLLDLVNNSYKVSGVIIPDIFYNKLSEIMPVKAEIHRNRVTKTTTIKY